ncbi:DJ-1/PfpI family protein [Actinoplanes bogorensis]|uniref:DJ-1/PfpI family protein n=1 Tax=Paractinoplanes bogorensis TaxID=1610840 RepID=A0ABS5Z482_9ACTN|nr:helix-turn-helix domain-containing protein [Actinoplanes bogorensis]MBU2670493.1 DJ-1/PfpI family protein [Actinoplanes bogorensis]
MPHQVAVVVLDGVVPFDLGTACQVFRAARDADRQRLYEVVVCGPGPVRSTAGFTVTPDHDLSAVDDADTVVVPGVDAGSTVTDGSLRDDVREKLLNAASRGARIVSICTGASVLAAAGLLDDRPAATHWAWGNRITRLYPRVRWNLDVLFVDDGDILTSAGVGAGVDLCLHIVRGDHGAEVANRAARRCVLPPWRDGGQAQFIERPVPHSDGTGTAPTRAWTLDRLAEPVSLEEMAEHARMSVRTFTRRFREETGTSPRQWLLRQRIAHAQLLLESTDLGVETVARRSGLGSATALRQHLQTAIGVAPTAYRRTFRQPVQSAS